MAGKTALFHFLQGMATMDFALGLMAFHTKIELA